MRHLKKQLALFFLLAVSVFYSGLPSLAADRQLQIAPVGQAPGGEKRLALVIGNSAYKTSPLRNPVNDARAISKALSATGFKVTVIEDATQTTMRRAIRTFGDELAAGGIGVFYYAGHGMQVKGKNFLIPVNADIEREDEVEDGAVDANFLLSKLDSARNALNVVILDACRNNPFARSFRSGAQGLAQMDAPSGTLIAFATAPGSVAADGDGDNGLYTKHLLAHLNKPGLPVEQLFKEVRIGVTRDTKDRQVPWESSSLKGNFFFVPGEAALSAEDQRRQIEKQVSERVATEKAEVQRQMQRVIAEMLAKQKAELEEELKRQASSAPKPPAAPDPLQMELAFWDSIKASTNPRDFQAYLEQYPKGTFAVLARSRATPPAPVVASAPPKPEPQKPVPAPVQVAAAPTPVKPVEAAKPAPTPVQVAVIQPPSRPAAPAIDPLRAEVDRATAEQPEQLGGPRLTAEQERIAAAQQLERLQPPRPERPAPVQVASIAPASALAGMGIDDPRFPKIGDRWGYEVVNLSTKATQFAATEINAVSPDGILETTNGRSRAHSAGAQLFFINPMVLQFSPYLLSFGTPKVGDTWRNIEAQGANFCRQAGNVCSFQAKVVGTEKVTTRAGTFDTLKVVVDMNTLFGSNRVWREYSFWFSQSTKRIVKANARTHSGNWNGPDYDVELVSYNLH